MEQQFWVSARAADKGTRKFANQLFEGVVAQCESIDELIGKVSENWKLERLASVEGGILRLAIHEIRSGRRCPR